MQKPDTRPLDALKPDAGQARQHYDQAELQRLGESLRERQLQPILIRPDGTIIAGHRRYYAAKLVGLASLQVIVVEGELSTAQVRGIQLTENIHRADLTPYEKWQACKELMELNGWQGKELAEHLHLDPSTVTRQLSPSRCIPEVREALREGKLGISDVYAISKLAPDDQPALLALKLGGATRDMLEQQGRKKRASAAPAVRAQKIKVPLVSGQVVSVSGEEISLEEAIEAASEAIKQMKQAVAKGLNAKTAMNVWRDIAAAG
jgi:ParB/RepB/Spo0J family partition protein